MSIKRLEFEGLSGECIDEVIGVGFSARQELRDFFEDDLEDGINAKFDELSEPQNNEIFGYALTK